MPPDSPETPEQAYARGFNEGWNQGMQSGLDYKRSIITLNAEKDLPMEFADYIDEQERDIIRSVVQMPEYKHYFRQNLLRQSILKHRQARLFLKDPAAMHLMHNLGNFISDLVVLYDNADLPDQTRIDPYISHGYDEPEDL